jgi:hypothetical protein
MNRSKLSLKAIMLTSGIGLAAAALGGSQPAAAQSYSDDYSCSPGYVYDLSYGCTLPYDYGYLPYYGGYGSYYGHPHRDFGHGFAHGMGGGFTHDLGGGFNHGVAFAHGGGGGFGHGVGFAHGGGGGFGHGGGGGHR